MAVSIAFALVQSRLDYANSILYGISSTSVNKLQRVQNPAVRIAVTPQIGFSSSQNDVKRSNWLPIKQRADFKIAALTYKV